MATPHFTRSLSPRYNDPAVAFNNLMETILSGDLASEPIVCDMNLIHSVWQNLND